jgi:hypothetical protein
VGWTKLSEEAYISDQSSFSLEKIDGIWYVIDNSVQKKSIPFTDIFNNPVFPVDYSNVDMIVKTLTSIGQVSADSLSVTNSALAKHFRGEAANTPSTPAFSFQGDLNSGIYRISEDKIGFSAGGSRQGEFGLGYGGFAGNIIQVVHSTSTHKQIISSTSYTDLLSGIGTVWETSITPKYSNSKILIIQNIQGLIYISGNTSYFGIGLSRKIGAGSYGLILNPSERQYGIAGGGLTSSYLNGQHFNSHLDEPSSTSEIKYKFSVRVFPGSAFYLNDYTSGTNNLTSTVTLMEVQV